MDDQSIDPDDEPCPCGGTFRECEPRKAQLEKLAKDLANVDLIESINSGPQQIARELTELIQRAEKLVGK